ncbi:ABC transporter substrate-binding protein [uncultured Azohydromonas sp.]|jgi:ABC-type Fe3+-hydroxamate transport system, periplasmic component|uniref:ABC transporter substrate-binding protein n=1 Tax=uncultured Azohydromonas sp. TaxID=487342 RepID=UPI0026152FD1|nr:helical backbone metal receptor [uncultured Azohydromonas sp.]
MNCRWPRRTLLSALALAATLVALPAAGEPLVLRDDRGQEHRFAAPPRRIVSLLPSLTEGVWALGGGARLVGVDRYSNWPAELAKLPRLGGMEDAQIEAIAALRPDVVLGSSTARSLDRLEALGLRVVRLKPETHADVRRTLEQLARLLGTPAEARRVWARIEQEMEAAARRVPASVRGQRVYFEIGGGPYAAGASSFIGQTLARLGMANIVPTTMGPFPKLNPEFVVRAQPDLILGPRREQAGMGERPGWSALAAIRNERRCGFETAQYDMLVRPGPRLGEAAGVLAGCLARLGGS